MKKPFKNKRSFLAFFFLFSLISFNFAKADVTPYYINSLKRYGAGFSEVKSPLVMRQEPKNDAKILETLNFDYKNQAFCQINKNRCEIDDIFAGYSTGKKLAFLTTIDTSDNWNLVCFNQVQSPVCGWVENEKNKFYTTGEFFEHFGKKYGVYLFKDLKKSDKILYSAPFKETNSTGSLEMPKFISPWLIRGNWILVKAQEYNNQFKTGYLNFRGADGKLKIFVNL